jgi:GntR family transcriptional regulator
MQFQHNGPAIYLQIADYLLEKILSGEWPEEDKIPSVRDTAVVLEVNPNTVMRSYDWLKQHMIIIDKRGVGFFVCKGGQKTALKFRQQEFLANEAPTLFRLMNMLQLTPDDLAKPFETFLKNKK